MTILLTSATDETSRYAVQHLLEHGLTVRAPVHKDHQRAEALRRTGAQVVVGDLLEHDGAIRATARASMAYFCYPARLRHHSSDSLLPMLCTFLSPLDHQLAIDPAREKRLASCGQPTLLTPVSIMDDHGRHMPRGERGEIVAHGNLVMQGYYKNPERRRKPTPPGGTVPATLGSWTARRHLPNDCVRGPRPLPP
jgi:acyl-CoA synthetase (AMP-forming)/AMP-acid ligase II